MSSVHFLEDLVAMDFSCNKGSAPMAIEKVKILGAFLELPAKQHRQFSPFGQFLRQMGCIGSAV